MRALSAFLVFVLIFSLQTQAQPKVLKKIKKELNTTVNSKEFATATIGFCLMDAQTGKVLVEYNSQKSFTPASAMKVITTGAALALLGDTFRFKTVMEFAHWDASRLGTKDAAIIFRGGGDPTFGSPRWNTTNTTKATILKKLSGNYTGLKIGIENSIFNDNNPPPGYNFSDLAYSYGAPLFAFNYSDNTQYLVADTLELPNNGNSIITHDTIFYHLVGDNNFVDYSDFNVRNFEDRQGFAEHNPLAMLAKELQKSDTNNIFKTEDDILTNNVIHQVFWKPLYTFYSPPLIDIAIETNQNSINLYAEGILRALGTQKYAYSIIDSARTIFQYYLKNEATDSIEIRKIKDASSKAIKLIENSYSTLDTSLAIAQRFWKNEVGDLKGLRMTDGSGLSRSNLCTPLLFCKILSAYTKRANFDSYYSTFAVAGQSGTVKNFATGTKAEGNAHIKTGTMSRVKSYVGYVTGNDGKLYSFALIFNNFEADAKPTAAATKIIALLPQLKMGKFFKVR